jgi:hypothetical protein
MAAKFPAPLRDHLIWYRTVPGNEAENAGNPDIFQESVETAKWLPGL